MVVDTPPAGDEALPPMSFDALPPLLVLLLLLGNVPAVAGDGNERAQVTLSLSRLE